MNQEAFSERPRRLLLSLLVPSWARPGPIPGPKGSRPDSPCACFVFQRFRPIQVLKWGPSWPVLVPSCSRAFLPGFGLDGAKQNSRPLPTFVPPANQSLHCSPELFSASKPMRTVQASGTNRHQSQPGKHWTKFEAIVGMSVTESATLRIIGGYLTGIFDSRRESQELF